MEKKIYVVSLCRYDENNVPEPVTNIFVRSSEDLIHFPEYALAADPDIAETIAVNNCDGIGAIFRCSEDEYEFYKEDGIDLIEF